MRARRVASLAAAAVVVAAATAGFTYSLLGEEAAAAMPLVRSGDLDIALVGPARWTETSPGLGSTHAFGMQQDQTTAQHLATPGDSFTLHQRFRAVLRGDRVAARVTVRWATAPDLAPVGGVTATYVVTMPDGTSSAPVPVGSPVTVPGGTGNITSDDVAAWAGAPWSVTVSLVYTGASAVVVAPSAVGDLATDLGTVVVELAQVRTGEGFR